MHILPPSLLLVGAPKVGTSEIANALRKYSNILFIENSKNLDFKL